MGLGPVGYLDFVGILVLVDVLISRSVVDKREHSKTRASKLRMRRVIALRMEGAVVMTAEAPMFKRVRRGKVVAEEEEEVTEGDAFLELKVGYFARKRGDRDFRL
jgi:hypothetical protein